MRYLGVSIAAGVCLLAAGAANAEERLANSDLDRVVAGFDLSQVTVSDIRGLSITPVVRDAVLLIGLSIQNSEIGPGLATEPAFQGAINGLIDFGVGPNPRPISTLDPATGQPVLDPATGQPVVVNLDRPAPITSGSDLLFNGSLLVPEFAPAESP